MKNYAAILALLFFFAGCLEFRPKFSETAFAKKPVPADKARIIFLRPPDSYPGAQTARLEIDGATVGKLARGEFLVADAAAGEREISVADPGTKGRFVLKLRVDAQQIYDLQVSRRYEDRKYEATGILSWIFEHVASSPNDDKGPFTLEPVSPWVVLRMLETLELAGE